MELIVNSKNGFRKDRHLKQIDILKSLGFYFEEKKIHGRYVIFLIEKKIMVNEKKISLLINNEMSVLIEKEKLTIIF